MERKQALAIVAETGKSLNLYDDARLRAAASNYHDAKAALDQARENLHQIIRTAREDGASAYRIAKIVHLSEREVGRIAPPKRA